MKPAFPTLPKATVAQLDDAYLELARFGKGQAEYIEMPALLSPHGLVTARWHCSWLDRLRILFSGDVYLQVLVNKKLQPVKLLSKVPTIEECR